MDSAHQRFIALGAKGQVAILDSRTGALVTSVRAGSDTTLAALDAAAGRMLLFGNVDRRLRVLDVRTGAVVATTSLAGMPSQLAVNEQADRAIVIDQGTTRLVTSLPTGQGAVEILDSLSGKRMSRIPAGAMPAILAADLGQSGALVQSTTAGRVMASVVNLRTGRMLSTFTLGMHA